MPKLKNNAYLRLLFGKVTPLKKKNNSLHFYQHPCSPLRLLSTSFVDEALGTLMLEEDTVVEHFRFHQQTQFGEDPENSSQIVGQNREAVH